MLNSLPKQERLHSFKEIEDLMRNGETLFAFPFKVIYRFNPDSSPFKIMVSVPKRNFKRAVKRNLLKRRIREAYRTNKTLLWSDNYEYHKSLNIFFIYIAKEELPYNIIERSVCNILKKLNVLCYEES